MRVRRRDAEEATEAVRAMLAAESDGAEGVMAPLEPVVNNRRQVRLTPRARIPSPRASARVVLPFAVPASFPGTLAVGWKFEKCLTRFPPLAVRVPRVESSGPGSSRPAPAQRGEGEPRGGRGGRFQVQAPEIAEHRRGRPRLDGRRSDVRLSLIHI